MPYQRGLNVVCGYVTVPENRADPAGRKVRLAVARVKSPSPDGAKSPIVRLAGGPGFGSLRELNLPASQYGAIDNPLLATHDLVYFDQRGTGYSTPLLDCPERVEATWTNLGRNAAFSVEYQTMLDAMQVCRARLDAAGIDVHSYDTVSNAADVADVRVALGIPTWGLWAQSYGTLLAQEVMRSHPQGVESVLLDSVVPPDSTTVTGIADSATRALDTLFTGCEQSPSCNAAYPNLRTRFDAMLNAYDQHPLVATIKDQDGKPRRISLDGSDFFAGVFNTMYDTKQIPLLPGIIQLMEQRSAALQGAFEQAFFHLFDSAEGMYYSVDCRDRFHDVTDADVVTLVDHDPHYGLLYQSSSVSGCQAWNAGAVDAQFNQLVGSDIPTLVLAGRYDPVTPPAGTKRVADHLGHATFAEFDATGHGVFRRNACASQLVTTFFDQPTTPPNTACVASVGPPKFQTP